MLMQRLMQTNGLQLDHFVSDILVTTTSLTCLTAALVSHVDVLFCTIFNYCTVSVSVSVLFFPVAFIVWRLRCFIFAWKYFNSARKKLLV